MPKQKLSAEAQQRMAKLTKKATDSLKRASRAQATSDSAMTGEGWDADSSAQLWDQAAEELRLTALECMERMQDMGASQKDLAPLWDMVLEAQTQAMES
jgi:hypothetical protein